MHEINEFARRLGYEELVRYMFVIGPRTHIGAYKKFQDDMDVLSLISLVGLDMIVEMYMTVPIKPMATDYSTCIFDDIVISSDDEDDVAGDIEDEVDNKKEDNRADGFKNDTYDFS